MAWYYVDNGQQVGPVDESSFAGLVSSGTIAAQTLVWREGQAEWLPYGQVAGPSPTAPTGHTSGADTVVCSVSGKSVPRSEAIEISGQWVSGAHKNEFLQKLKEGAAVPGSFRYAGFWIRFVAWFIDAIILTIVNGIIMAALIPILGLQEALEKLAHPPAGQDPAAALASLQALIPMYSIILGASFLVQIIYYIFFNGKFGATPGKILLGLKIVQPNGAPISYGRATGRYFALILSGIILYIGFFMAAFDSEKRALHDRICSTRVIKK